MVPRRSDSAALAERWLEAHEGAFHCLDWGGSGPLLHIGHATGYCAAVYAPLASRLTGNARVIGMDDRGHGKSTVAADPRLLHGWKLFADDLAEALGQFGEPVVAVGHSRGGTVALMVAARHPELVRALVLIDPTILPRWWMPLWRAARRTGLAGYAPIAHRAARRRHLWPDRETILAAYASRPPFNRWHRAFLEAYVREGTKETSDGRIAWRCNPAWEARCFSTCPDDIWREVPRVRCPTLVVYGRDSDTFRRAAARRFARVLPRARLVALDETSHFAPMERPGETAAAIVAFLPQASRSAAPHPTR